MKQKGGDVSGRNNSPFKNLVVYLAREAVRHFVVAVSAFLGFVLFLGFWILSAKALGARELLHRCFDFGDPSIWTFAGILSVALFLAIVVVLTRVARKLGDTYQDL